MSDEIAARLRALLPEASNIDRMLISVTDLRALLDEREELKAQLHTVLSRETASIARHDARLDVLEAERDAANEKLAKAILALPPGEYRTADPREGIRLLRERLEAAEAELAKAVEALRWIDRKGGMGLDVHYLICATLAQIDAGTVEHPDSARLREALKDALASLVAMTSLIIRAEDEKRQPSKVVASDRMFRQMLVDYDNATIKARRALGGTNGK